LRVSENRVLRKILDHKQRRQQSVGNITYEEVYDSYPSPGILLECSNQEDKIGEHVERMRQL